MPITPADTAVDAPVDTARLRELLAQTEASAAALRRLLGDEPPRR